WAGIAGLVYWPGMLFLTGWIASGLATTLGLWPLRRGAEMHWTERARIGYPVRVALAVGLVLSLVLPSLLARSMESPFSVAPAWLTPIAAALAGWTGMSLGVRRSWLGLPRLPFRERVRSSVVLTALYLPTLLVFAALVAVMPLQMNRRAWITLGIGAVAMALVLWRSGLPVLRLLGLAVPASERLRQAVDRAVERVGVQPAAVWEVPWTVANAMALVFSRQIVFTTGALLRLDDEQLTAVAAHELGHLSERPGIKAVRTLGAWILLALSTAVPLYRTYGWMGLGCLYVAFLGVSAGMRRVGRRMEVRADAIGLGTEGSAGVYARALERMYETNLVPAVMRGRLRVHPPLWDRMVAAGVTPDYPRPRPPGRWKAFFLQMLLVIVFGAGWIVMDAVVPGFLAPRLLEQGTAEAFRIGVKGDLAALWRLAKLRGRQGRVDEEVALWKADSELEPYDFSAPARLAFLEAGRGHCTEAARHLSAAKERYTELGNEDDDEEEIPEAQKAVAACVPEGAKKLSHILQRWTPKPPPPSPWMKSAARFATSPSAASGGAGWRPAPRWSVSSPA